jgi:hypothetical protein
MCGHGLQTAIIVEKVSSRSFLLSVFSARNAGEGFKAQGTNVQNRGSALACQLLSVLCFAQLQGVLGLVIAGQDGVVHKSTLDVSFSPHSAYSFSQLLKSLCDTGESYPPLC